MALTRFEPDEELFDPSDPESWIGRWHHDDGQSFYGKGSPDLGEPILARRTQGTDERLAQAAPEEQDERLDAPPPLLRRPEGDQEPPPMLARPPEAPEQAAAPWENDVPPEVAAALREQATAAGLNPDTLAQVIRKESGWNPSSVNRDTQKHGGLIQFSRDGFPAVAKAAGRPDVTWEQMLDMSAAEQMPFVAAYYKGKGLTPQSTIGDYARRTFMPAYADAGDDFRLGERGSNEMRGDVRSGKVYEQNQRLDLNQDGVITNREVGEAYAGAAGGGPQLAPGQGAPGAGQMPGAPGSYNGLPLAGVQMRGAPRSPGDVRAQTDRVAQRYATVVGQHQQAEQLRGEGRAEMANYLVQQTELEKADQTKEAERQAAIAAKAQARIDQDVSRPIQEVDPSRLIKNMSTGQKIVGAIAVLISAIGQAANSMLRINSPNLALEVLNDAIERDIASQKEAIDRDDRQANNRIAHWSKVLGSAEQGERAARAEAKSAAGKLMQLRAGQLGDDKERQAALLDYSAQMFAAGQQELEQILQHENERMLLEYAPPKATERGPDALLKAIQSSKLAYQELINSGRTPEQAREIMEASGSPVVTGETVDQKAARETVERKEDEETSKELQPVNEAESAWRNALERLKALEGHALTTQGYKPGKLLATDVTSTLPGWPSLDEQRSFEQSITAATNAQIAALGRASDSDEDRIKSETIGAGDIASYRRGIERQLQKLEERRRMLNARRPGAATRTGEREAQAAGGEAGIRRPVTGRIGGPL